MSEVSLEPVERIGEGVYGSVWKYRRIDDNIHFAVKRVLARNLTEKIEALREIQHAQILKHENIVGYYNFWIDKKGAAEYFNIQMEFLEGGSLRQALEMGILQRRPEIVVGILRDVFNGLKFLHEKNLIHRDIKTAIDQKKSWLRRKKQQAPFPEDFGTSLEKRTLTAMKSLILLMTSTNPERRPTAEEALPSKTFKTLEESKVINYTPDLSLATLSRDKRQREVHLLQLHRRFPDCKRFTSDELERGKKIGGGNFGVIYEGKLKQNDETLRVAIKSTAFLRGDAFTLTFNYLISFAWQIAVGLQHLHSQNCLHRDMAARNILLSSRLVIKIGDFGLAKKSLGGGYERVGRALALPIRYLAPEALRKEQFTTKSDVWSYGIVLYELFSLGDQPQHIRYESLEAGKRWPRPVYCPAEMFTFCVYAKSFSYNCVVQKCWIFDRKSRPEISEAEGFFLKYLASLDRTLLLSQLTQVYNTNSLPLIELLQTDACNDSPESSVAKLSLPSTSSENAGEFDETPAKEFVAELLNEEQQDSSALTINTTTARRISAPSTIAPAYSKLLDTTVPSLAELQRQLFFNEMQFLEEKRRGHAELLAMEKLVLEERRHEERKRTEIEESRVKQWLELEAEKNRILIEVEMSRRDVPIE